MSVVTPISVRFFPERTFVDLRGCQLQLDHCRVEYLQEENILMISAKQQTLEKVMKKRDKRNA